MEKSGRLRRNIFSKGNTFDNCNYDGEKRPVISIGGNQDNKGSILGKIIINNNTFNSFNPSIVVAIEVQHLEFTNNTINNSKTLPSTSPDAFVLDIKQVETLKIINVKISEAFTNKIKSEEVKNNLSEIK